MRTGLFLTACLMDQDYAEEYVEDRPQKKSNVLPLWGNEKTMNLNSLVLTNIQSSQYFKVKLFKLKTYHEVIDEIYYQVNHLEPWEKGSRVTAGQTGMCGGVRGVGAGGIVSTAFCILYKLFTLRLTRKQVLALMNHSDSPYIRGLGFMFTQPPADLWDWFEPYLDDEEEIDVRAGGGQTTTIGSVVKHMLTKLDWYATLFPRIPVPIQKDMDRKLTERFSSDDQYPSGYSDNRTKREDDYDSRDQYRDRQENWHARYKDRNEQSNFDRDRDAEKDRYRNRERDDHLPYDRIRDLDKNRYRNWEKDDRLSYDRDRDLDKDRYRNRERDDRLSSDRDRGTDRYRSRDKYRRIDEERNRDRDRYKDSRGSERNHDKNSSSSKNYRNREHHDGYEKEKHRARKDRKRSRSHSRDRSRRHRD